MRLFYQLYRSTRFQEMFFLVTLKIYLVLQHSFWNRLGWIKLKASVEQLARSLASYADQLLAKRVRMQTVHDSNEAIRDIGQNLKLQFTGVRMSSQHT